MTPKFRFLLGLLLCFSFLTAGAAPPLIRLATTTSTENSGLLETLLPAFQARTGYRVHVIAVGTGKALRMARDGDVDVVLVHAPKAEKAFVAEGHGEKRYPVMHNDFVLVGPPTDPAGVRSATSAADAFRRIAAAQALFVSRGDDSGTHKKELSLWQAAAVEPVEPWYREAGQGMGKVLQMADEMGAYTLTDRGTWLAMKDHLRLSLLYQGDAGLFNPYHIIPVNPARHPQVNHAGAMALVKWLTGSEGQRRIAAFRKEGQQLFVPDVLPETQR